MAKVTVGTISHGTMRNEDLIPCFLDELTSLDKDAAGKIEIDFPEYESAEEDDEFWEETASWMLEALFDALNEHAPAFCYFGALEGDGSDYGFWPMLDAAEEESFKVNDLGEVPDDYIGNVLQVSDHGNATLYYAENGKFTEEWSIV